MYQSSTSCTISGVDSDGSAGDLIIDANGNLSLNGNTNDPRFFDSTTLGKARGVTTTFENINNFIIAAGQTANILGTNIVKAKRIVIDGTLDGNGGGYAGASAKRNNGRKLANPTNPPSTVNPTSEPTNAPTASLPPLTASQGGGGSRGRSLSAAIPGKVSGSSAYSSRHYSSAYSSRHYSSKII